MTETLELREAHRSMITAIRYRWGLCTDPQDPVPPPSQVAWTAPAVPGTVLDSLEREDVLRLAGEYGRPEWGDPVEVDLIEIETGSATVSCTIYNRGILLFFHDSDAARRLHRFCCVMKDTAQASAGTLPP